MTRFYKTLYFTLQWFRREPVKRAFEDLIKSEELPLDSLKHIQFKRLYNCLNHAIEKVPFYRVHLADYKEQILALDSWEDAERLMLSIPPVTKELFIENMKAFYSEDIKDRNYFENKTSGSTGNPIIFPCDQESWAYRHAAAFRQLNLFGVEIGAPYGYFFGQHWKGKFKTKIKDLIFNRVRVSAFNLSLNNTPIYFQKLKNKRVQYFLGYPQTILEFLMYCKQLDLDVRDLPLKVIVCTADTLRREVKDQIEVLSGVPCANQYGSVEGGAGAFSGLEGFMHISMETTWLQVQNNEIYKTDLFLRSCPLIKFKVGDRSEGMLKLDSQLKQSHIVVKNILGRTQEDIVLSNGKRINAHLPNYIFKNVPSDWRIVKFRFYVCANEAVIRLYIHALTNLNPEQIKRIKEDVNEAFGNDLTVNIIVTDNFPLLPNAKHRILLKDDSC